MSNFTDMQSGELDRQAEMMENTYKRHASKRSGPLEVGMIEGFQLQFTDGKSSKKQREDSDSLVVCWINWFDCYYYD